MDIKTKIDGLSEGEAKATLEWALCGLAYRLRCDECPSCSRCPVNEPLVKSDVCLCLLLDAALKMTKEGQQTMNEQEKYPQDEEQNEYRYIAPAWLDAVARGLTAGAMKHPGETWRTIPSSEHAARALRHLNMYLMGDRSEPHLINASMRCMMAAETEAMKKRIKEVAGK